MSCDVLNSVNDLWFRLGFTDQADLDAGTGFVTNAQLYQYIDDRVKVLARTCSVFLTYDASIAVTPGTAVYALPAGHVFTEGAWLLYASAPLQLLRLSTVGQLFALDAAWSEAAEGPPLRLSLDAAGANNCVLYPGPSADATLAQIIQQLPATVAAGASVLPLSPVLQDYFTDAAIAGARSAESDSAMPEIGDHLKERMALYEAVLIHLFGGGR
jgi:hypothetical protein